MRKPIKLAIQLYDALPTTVPPREFLAGHGNWGLKEHEFKLAEALAKFIAAETPGP